MSKKANKLAVVVVMGAAACFLAGGIALAAQCAWCDEMANSLSFYKTNYPTSNFAPYLQKVGIVRDAVGRGDQKAVKSEIGELFKMLRARAHGINDVAADELLGFWQTVTPPIEEHKLSTPDMSPDEVNLAAPGETPFIIKRNPPDTRVFPPDDHEAAGWYSDGS